MVGGLMDREHAATASSPSRTAPRNPGILIADDMASIRALLRLELEPRGFNVWLAADGDDAVDLYRHNHLAIDVVLLDVQMPGLDGPQTLAALQQFDRKVRACFMTGDPGIYNEADLRQRGAACVFHKPFQAAAVAQTLDQLAEAAEGDRASASPSFI